MTELEMLQDFSYEKGIDVFECYHESKIKGCCMVDNDKKAVLINKANISTSADELGVLAEELGHLETGTVLPCENYLSPEYKKWLKRKNEILAKRWAYEKLNLAEKIKKAIKSGCNYIWEIAEEIGMDADFLNKAINFFENQGISLYDCEEDY